MPSRSLEQLQQHIAQQESELERLRRALAERRQQLESLQRRQRELHEQLRQIDAQIAAVEGAGGAAADTPKPSSRPKAPAGRPAPKRGQPSLRELIVTTLRESGRPLTANQLAEEVLRRGFVSTSGNFAKLTKKRVHELHQQGVLQRAAGQPGFVLAKPAAGPKAATGVNGIPDRKPTSAPAGKRAVSAKGASANGAPKRASGPPAKAGRSGKQPPLREVLTDLLRRSKRPVGGTELARQAQAAGYRTASQDFAKVVWVMLATMDNVERVPGEGYRLKKR
jgi:uncharacterized coiled-coil protein SlyX